MLKLRSKLPLLLAALLSLATAGCYAGYTSPARYGGVWYTPVGYSTYTYSPGYPYAGQRYGYPYRSPAPYYYRDPSYYGGRYYGPRYDAPGYYGRGTYDPRYYGPRYYAPQSYGQSYGPGRPPVIVTPPPPHGSRYYHHDHDDDDDD